MARGLFALIGQKDDESDESDTAILASAWLVESVQEMRAVRLEIRALHKTIIRALKK